MDESITNLSTKLSNIYDILLNDCKYNDKVSAYITSIYNGEIFTKKRRNNIYAKLELIVKARNPASFQPSRRR